MAVLQPCCKLFLAPLLLVVLLFHFQFISENMQMCLWEEPGPSPVWYNWTPHILSLCLHSNHSQSASVFLLCWQNHERSRMCVPPGSRSTGVRNRGISVQWRREERSCAWLVIPLPHLNSLSVFQLFRISLSPSLSQWRRDQETQSLCPALWLDSLWVATGCTGYVRNQRKDWSGLESFILALLLTMPSLSKASSPSPKTAPKTCCSWRWKA